MLHQPKTLNLPDLVWYTLHDDCHVGNCKGYKVRLEWWLDPGKGNCTVVLPSQATGMVLEDMSVDEAQQEAAVALHSYINRKYSSAWHTARELEECFK